MPKRTARVVSRKVYSPPSSDLPTLPPVIREILDEGDPAMQHITHALLRARLAGENLMDPEVAGRCVAQGRQAHAFAVIKGTG